jgi:CO/xanthine dehydrogenase Mo-binding subunit
MAAPRKSPPDRSAVSFVSRRQGSRNASKIWNSGICAYKSRRAGKASRSATVSRPVRQNQAASLFGNFTLRTEGGVDARTGQGKGSSFWFYSAAGAEVEVDIETGKLRVLKIATAVDVGKAIHPKQCDLQNEGSALAGLGSALFEEMRFDNGQPINGTFLDYLLPSMQDHPVEFQSVLVETPHPDGPFGAKGMGEAALPPMAAAIGNAVTNALNGVRVRDLPIKPDKIVAAMNAARDNR